MAVLESRRTSGTDRWRAIDERFKTLVYLFLEKGVPEETAMQAAFGLMPHLIRETGWFRNEWNFAPGNIKCRGSQAPADEPGWHGDCHWLTNRTDGRDLYRSYATIRDGLADYLRLQESKHYQPALRYLLTTGDGRGWYDRLMKLGYHPWSEQALQEYDSIARSLTQLAQREMQK